MPWEGLVALAVDTICVQNMYEHEYNEKKKNGTRLLIQNHGQRDNINLKLIFFLQYLLQIRETLIGRVHLKVTSTTRVMTSC